MSTNPPTHGHPTRKVANSDNQSHQASAVVKQEGGKNDLLERIKKTEFFKVSIPNPNLLVP